MPTTLHEERGIVISHEAVHALEADGFSMEMCEVVEAEHAP